MLHMNNLKHLSDLNLALYFSNYTLINLRYLRCVGQMTYRSKHNFEILGFKLGKSLLEKKTPSPIPSLVVSKALISGVHRNYLFVALLNIETNKYSLFNKLLNILLHRKHLFA